MCMSHIEVFIKTLPTSNWRRYRHPNKLQFSQQKPDNQILFHQNKFCVQYFSMWNAFWDPLLTCLIMNTYTPSESWYCSFSAFIVCLSLDLSIYGNLVLRGKLSTMNFQHDIYYEHGNLSVTGKSKKLSFWHDFSPFILSASKLFNKFR